MKNVKKRKVKKDFTNLYLAFLGVAILLGSFFMIGGITGLFSGPDDLTSYEKDVNWIVEGNENRTINLEFTPGNYELVNLMVTGNYEGEGTVNVYLEDSNGNRHLILDNDRINEEIMMITGNVVADNLIYFNWDSNWSIENSLVRVSLNEEIYDITIQFVDTQVIVDLDNFAFNSTGIGYVDLIVGEQVVDSTRFYNEEPVEVIEEVVNETVEIVNETIEEVVENITEEIVEEINETIIEEEVVEETANETIEEVVENVTEEVINETIEEVINETIIERTITTDFEEKCVETCSLPGLDTNNYTIIFEVDLGILTIDKVDYRLRNITNEEMEFNKHIRDSRGEIVDYDLEFVDSESGDIEKSLSVRKPRGFGLFGGGSSKLKINKGHYNIKVRPKNHPIKDITFPDTEIGTNVDEFIKIDDVDETDTEFIEVYAIDPTEFNFTSATVSVVARGVALYKCKGWDFVNQNCYGKWELFKSGLTPGEEYSFILTPDDPGFGETPPGTIIGETGNVSISNHNSVTLEFKNTYTSTPIVIATPATQNGDVGDDDSSLILVIEELNTTHVTFNICQDNGETTCDTTVNEETIHYFVFDVDATYPSWIAVGVQSSVATDGSDTAITFGKTFSNTPYVFTQSQTNNQGNNIAPIAWVDDITTTGANFLGCTHQGIADACDASTPSENIGWIAIDPVNANFSNHMNFQIGSADISNSDWTAATFSPTYLDSRVMVTQNDDDGGQDPEYAWARNVTSSGMDFRYCEQDAADVCHSHTSEFVMWFAMEYGYITIGEEIANDAPTTPTSITCDGGSCNSTFANDIELICSGSTDNDGDNITYFIEANYSTYSCSNNGDCGSCSDSSECGNCSTAGCSWGSGMEVSPIHFTGMETDDTFPIDGWIDGGTDCLMSSSQSAVDDSGIAGGTDSIEVQDNSATSYTAQTFDLSAPCGGSTCDSINISLYLRPNSFDNTNEGFDIWCDYGTGSAYEVADWKDSGAAGRTICGTEVPEDSWTKIECDISSVCTIDSAVEIRITSQDSSSGGNQDQVYIDGINITGYRAVTECSGSLDCSQYNDQTSCGNCNQCMWNGTSSWNLLGNHTQGNSLIWNLSGIQEQSNVGLRCRANDLEGSGTFSSYYGPLINLTIANVVLIPSSVNLISPLDESNDSNGYVKFKYNVTAEGNISSCTLALNNSLEITDNSIEKNVEQQFIFDNLSEGSYSWYINCTNGVVTKSEIRTLNVVFPENYTDAPIIVNETIEDAQGNPIPATIAFVDASSGETDYNATSGNATDITSGLFNIEITPDNHVINEIEFINVQINGNVTEIIDFDNSPETSGFAEIYGINPLLNFTYDYINVTVTATTKDLFKCPNWDFNSATCTDSRWKKIKDIVPGQDYTFSMDAVDPGFGESNWSINVLDHEDYLEVYTESVIDNSSGILDVNLDVDNHTVLDIMVYDYDSSSDNNDIYIDENVNTTFIKQYSIDPTPLSFASANVTVNASSSSEGLWKCSNYSFETRTCYEDCEDIECNGSWQYISDVTAGQTYSFVLTPNDPSFMETVDNADSYVLENNANRNFGGREFLAIQSRSGRDSRGYITFSNLSGIPANSVIEDAQACFYYYDKRSGSGTRTLDIHHIFDDNWNGENEGTITWNNQVCGTGFDNSTACNLTILDGQSVDTTENRFICWDVTEAVKKNYLASEDLVSFVLKDNSEDSGTAEQERFRSREYSNASQHPYLYINYSILNDSSPPVVSDLLTNGTIHAVNASVLINAKVTDDYLVDTVLANITKPDNTTSILVMTYNIFTNRYEAICNNTNLLGTYNVQIIANDTSGNVNDGESTSFKIVRPFMYIEKIDSPDPVQVGGVIDYQINYTVNMTSGIVLLDFQDFKFVTFNDFPENSPQLIESSDGTLIIAYHGQPGSNQDIYVIRSTDKGATWSSPIQVTDEAEDDTFPNIFQANDGKILIPYVHAETSNDIWIVYSDDDGLTWSEPFAIADNSTVSEFEPSIEQDSNGMFYLAYAMSLGDTEIVIQNSTSFSSDWSDPIFLTNNSHSDYDIEMLIDSNDMLYFAWAPEDPDYQEIWFGNMTADMIGFNALDNNKIQITDNDIYDYETSLNKDNFDNIYIGWVGLLNNSEVSEANVDRDSNEIFLASSFDSGTSWDIRQITDNNYSDSYPGIVQTGADGLYYISALSPNGTELDVTFAQRVYSPEDAINVIIRDEVPNGTTVEDIRQGGSLQGDTIVWNFPVIYAGTEGYVSFDVRVNNTVPHGTVINNTANITYYEVLGSLIGSINSSTDTTVIDDWPPSVTDLMPNGSNVNQSTAVIISANVTDNGVIDTVLANVSIPSDGTEIVQMLFNSSTGKYEGLFTTTGTLGRYNYTIIANDTAGNVNDSESSFFIAINDPPSTPTNLTCDGGSCNNTFNTTIELNCSGSIDPNNDSITYHIEALFEPLKGNRTVLYAQFETDNQSFIYQDDLYGTSNPTQAVGEREQHSNCTNGYCLNVELNLNSPITGGPFSGGWNRSLVITNNPEYVLVTFDYSMRIDDETETDDNITLMYTNLTDGSTIAGSMLQGITGTDFVDEFLYGSVSYFAYIENGTYEFDAGCRLDTVDNTNENGECWVDNVFIKEVNTTILDKAWWEIGTHEEGETFVWNIFDEKPQSGVDFRCRAIDNGSNTFSDYYTVGGNATIIEDVKPPSWYYNRTSPSSPATYVYGGDYQFNITWIDNGIIDTVLFEHNFSGIPQNYSYSGVNGNEYFYNFTDLAVGTYYWRSFANDTSGNANQTDMFIFEVVSATPTCSLAFTPASPQGYGTAVNASCSCTNPETSAVLYRDGDDVTTSENNQYIVIPGGNHTYNCTTPVTQNYSSATNTSNYVINKGLTNTTLYINGSTDDFTGNVTFSVNYTCVANVSGNLNLTENGIGIAYGPSPLTHISTYTTGGDYLVNCSFEENQNYSGSSDTSTIHAIGGELRLEWGSVDAVGDNWVKVNTIKNFTSPVVVGSVNYYNNTIPSVIRFRNVSSTSFEVRVQNPSGSSLNGTRIHYLIVEQGNWTLPNGTKIEAYKYMSAVVGENNNWIGESRNYINAYTTPVVLASVMTYNDPKWQTVTAWGSARANPPDSSNLVLSRNVAEDTDISRLNETVGYVVIEQGHYTGDLESVFEAYLGADSVEGVGNSPPYTYNFNTAFTNVPEVAVVTLTGLDGGNGGWAQLHGLPALTTTQIDLSIDEDQINDAERSHITEQVSYVVFEDEGEYPAELVNITSITILPDADEFTNGTQINPLEESNVTVNIVVNITNTTAVDTCLIRVFNSSDSYSSPTKGPYVGVISSMNNVTQCLVNFSMEYWRSAGDYNVSVDVNMTNGIDDNDNSSFYYNSLKAHKISVSSIFFSSMPGQEVNSSNAYPLSVKNVGNLILNISLKSTDFVGVTNPSYIIGVGNITYNSTEYGDYYPLSLNFANLSSMENLIPTQERNLYFRGYAPVGILSQEYNANVTFRGD